MGPERSFDVLIVGAGPAGMAAAWAARASGQRVGVVDDNPSWGGQIWRGETARSRSAQVRHWLERAQGSGAELLAGTRVVASPGPDRLWAERADERLTLSYRRLILATGARERFLPFPGWTLPGVLGAGGLQALVKNGLPIEGRRVVVAGSGPLLLAVAAYLRHKGAIIPLIAEQAPWNRLARFGLGLIRQPAKALQALFLRSQLWNVRYQTSCHPTAAKGPTRLEAVELRGPAGSRTVECDYLACGFGLVPNLELPRLLGCAVEAEVIVINEWQQTSVPEVYCAGEPTGIGGVELALVEGQIAGYAATEQRERARRLWGLRGRGRDFARRLESAFALHQDLLQLPTAETIVCRCEDVTWTRLQPYTSWRSAKLQTRCGMGPCQGRVCGPALEFLRGWERESAGVALGTPRPPVFPARLSSLVQEE